MSNNDGDMIVSPEKFDHVSEHSICRLVDAFYAKVRLIPTSGRFSPAPFPATGNRI